MKRFVRYFRNITTLCGSICLFLGAFTSDFHVIELGQNEPESVDTFLIWGVVLLIPMFLHDFFVWLKGYLRRSLKR